MKPLSQMTEEELKTLCKSLESRYGENSTVTIKQADFNNMWTSIDRYAKENKCLQEQLNEANDIITSVAAMPRFPVNPELCREYLKKWGVK